MGMKSNLTVLILFHYLDLGYISIWYYCINVANCCLVQFCIMLGFEIKFDSFEMNMQTCVCRSVGTLSFGCLSEKIIHAI